VDPSYANQDAGADVAVLNRLNQLKAGSRAAGKAATGGRGNPRGGQRTAAAITAPPLHFKWVAVLWRLALTHDHPMVQRSALKTLLKRSWTAPFICQVPAGFLSDCLLPALNAPIHHRPGADFDATAAAARLLAAWAAVADAPEVRRVVEAVLGALAAPATRDMNRNGVVAYITCLEAAATAAGSKLLDGLSGGSAGDSESSGVEPREGESAAWAAAQLDKLTTFLKARGWPHGAGTHAACCVLGMRLAARIAPCGGVCTDAFSAALRLLLAQPAWCAVPAGGELYLATRAWFLGGADDDEGGDGGAEEGLERLQQQAQQLWGRFFASGTSSTGSGSRQPSSQRDYVNWSVECRGWTR